MSFVDEGGRRTNTGNTPLSMPTLDPPVLLQPGESCKIPEPEPVAEESPAEPEPTVPEPAPAPEPAQGPLDPPAPA